MMTDTFDEYKFKEKASKGEATVTVLLKNFDKSHAANAEKTADGTLKITAKIGSDDFAKEVSNVDIQPQIKVQKHKGKFDVVVTKNSDFRLEDMFAT